MLSYVIQRPDGNIVLGGTLNVDDWYPLPRPATKIAIMEKALALWPEIAPPGLWHGGTGFESLWGSAPMAVEFMEDALKAV
ncbi:hypothetical protein B0H11DRAFT_2239058 [Mycena galericulata]|nr:hypothetical protein B0H11DRAFT_2239058 [Mycena galericulata]